MKKTQLILLLALTVFLTVGSTVLSAAKNASSLAERDSQGRLVYADDAITVKFKPQVKLNLASKSLARTGIPSVDSKLDHYGVLEMTQRFKQKPLAKGSKLPDLRRIYKIEVPAGANLQKMINDFNADPNVEYAERIPMDYQMAVPDDEYYTEWLYHLPQIHAEQAWDVWKGEDGDPNDPVVISICDTGIDWKHPDLAANIYNNLGEDADGDGHVLEQDGNGEWIFDPGDVNDVDDDGNGYVDDFIGWNVVADQYGNENNDPMDPATRGHGSHCAGLAAGVTNNGTGIASISWNIKVMCTSHGFVGDNGTSVYNAYQGIIYAAENGADVINTSWGGGGYSQSSEEVIAYAYGLGSIIVSSAGNNDNAVHQYPSDYPNVVSVASVDRYDQKAWYSTYGIGVDVCTPGGNHEPGLLSTVSYDNVEGFPGYDFYSGTSMASPVTVGLFGLVKSKYPDWTNEQLITQVIGTTDNIDSHIPDYIGLMGSGRINAYKALTATDVHVPQILELEIWDVQTDNQNVFDGQMMPGDTARFSLTFRNYSHFVADSSARILLVSDDPGIEIVKGSVVDTIFADGYSDIDYDFTLAVNEQTTTHTAACKFVVESDMADIPLGSEYPFNVVISTIQSTPAALNFNETYGDGSEKSFTLSNVGTDPIDFVTEAVEYSPPYFHLDTTNAYDGLSWWCADVNLGRYADNTLQFMDLPVLDTDGATAPVLTFMSDWDLEGSTGAADPYDGWDGANVWVSTDSGKTFNVMPPTSPVYTATSLWSFSKWGYGVGIPGWNGNSDGWQAVEFDLSPYKSKNLIIRFAFASDENTNATGWWLDNIKVADGANVMYENNGTMESSIMLQGSGGEALSADWMNVSVSEATLQASSDLNITVGVDTRNLESGAHSAAVRIIMDTTVVVANIPINLFVAPPAHDLKANTFEVPDDKFLILQPKPLKFKLDNRGENDETEVRTIVDFYQNDAVAFSDTVVVDQFPAGTSMNLETAPFRAIRGGDYEVRLQVTNVTDDYNAFNDTLSGIVKVDNIFEDFSTNTGAWDFQGMAIDTGHTGFGDIYALYIDQGHLPYRADLNTSATYAPGLDVSGMTQGTLSFMAQFATQADVDILYLDVSTDNTNWENRGQVSGTSKQFKQFRTDVTDLIQGGADRIWFRFRFVSDATTQLYGLFVDNIGFFNEEFLAVDGREDIPTKFALNQNYPNPFNPTTTISYALPEASAVTLTVFNIRGEKIREWSVSNQTPGNYDLVWDAKDQSGRIISSGVYFYRLKTKNNIEQKKMLFLK